MIAWHKQHTNKYFDSFSSSITFLDSRLFTFKRHHYYQLRSILKPDSHLYAEQKMATLDSLKRVLRKKSEEVTPSPPNQPLSDAQYSKGLDILKQGPGWLTYENFIIPHTLQLLGPLIDSRTHVSVLEIGPGPISLLSYLPRHLRNKVGKYKAFEPNSLFAARLEEALGPNSEQESTLPCMKSPPDICRQPFDVESNKAGGTGTINSSRDDDEKYDAIIFCHSMYGMNPKHRFIERALKMITGSPDHLAEGGLVLVFHRDNRALHFGNLASYQTASFPNGVVRVADNDEELDSFASFVAGFSVQEGTDVGNTIRSEWRKVCRALGRREEHQKGRLMFSSPELMVAFSFCSSWLRELEDAVPLTKARRILKSREALLHHPVPVVEPKNIHEVQGAVQWALECNLSLTVVGGSHTGHCLWPNVVAVDMSAFNHIHIVMKSQQGEDETSPALIVAETGCNTGDIIRTTMEEGLTVPLGARPSVGAGMWLQGGIGHLARLHGLTCDAIVGAVIISVYNPSQILCVGNVPTEHQPAGAIRPENEADLLWAIKGAGTNLGIVISLTFQAYAAPTFKIRNWVVKLDNTFDVQQKISEFDAIVTKKLPRNSSSDAYLYWENSQLHLGVTLFEASTDSPASSSIEKAMAMMDSTWGTSDGPKIMDGVGLFEAEMYVSRMHGGHGGGKTSSFKRCVFLKHIGGAEVASHLVAAIKSRPTPLCYLHLLQGGGAIRDVAPDATAFSCRNWHFACVITGVWSRDEDETDTVRCATQWVYDVAVDLLALSNCRGAYGADLGPDPRDSVLASKAFRFKGSYISYLKHIMDPQKVLAYACPLPKTQLQQKIIILVTGDSCAGKDFSANVWASVFGRDLITRVVSISSATKREYAEAVGADLGRLFCDRAYKEQHRPALTAFFKKQVHERPNLPEEQFLSVVRGVADVDVLLITGMRDEAPLAAFSHLVPNSRLLEVYVQASEHIRRSRGGRDDIDGIQRTCEGSSQLDTTVLSYCPSLVFTNELSGNEAAENFAEENLYPFLRPELFALEAMVDVVPDFPRPGIRFLHVLGIAQKRDGLSLCTSLLQSHFAGNWATVDSIACCEAGGFVFASALALKVGLPLLLIREAGKLPPPTVSVAKNPSYVSSAISDTYTPDGHIELELDKVPEGAEVRVVVVDDVLSTGETMCAVLQLLEKAGVRAENVSVMVVAEFPVHRGRKLLLQHGFGRTRVQSLLVFGGA